MLEYKLATFAGSVSITSVIGDRVFEGLETSSLGVRFRSVVMMCHLITAGDVQASLSASHLPSPDWKAFLFPLCYTQRRGQNRDTGLKAGKARCGSLITHSHAHSLKGRAR